MKIFLSFFFFLCILNLLKNSRNRATIIILEKKEGKKKRSTSMFVYIWGMMIEIFALLLRTHIVKWTSTSKKKKKNKIKKNNDDDHHHLAPSFMSSCGNYIAANLTWRVCVSDERCWCSTMKIFFTGLFRLRCW